MYHELLYDDYAELLRALEVVRKLHEEEGLTTATLDPLIEKLQANKQHTRQQEKEHPAPGNPFFASKATESDYVIK